MISYQLQLPCYYNQNYPLYLTFDKFRLKSNGLCGFPWLNHIKSWNQTLRQMLFTFRTIYLAREILVEFPGENILSSSQWVWLWPPDNKPNLFTAVLMFSWMSCVLILNVNTTMDAQVNKIVDIIPCLQSCDIVVRVSVSQDDNL